MKLLDSETGIVPEIEADFLIFKIVSSQDGQVVIDVAGVHDAGPPEIHRIELHQGDKFEVHSPVPRVVFSS